MPGVEPNDSAERPRRRVAVTGASGFLGSALVHALRRQGDEVVRLVRHPPRRDDEWPWSTEHGLLEQKRLLPVDVLVHLAGENIAAARFSERRKAVLRASRIRTTRLLVESLAEVEKPPQHFLCASAGGYYGSRGDERLDEFSAAGEGFLAELCDEWEREAKEAQSARTQVTLLRTGLVLSPGGGALGKMLPIFRLGLGGRLGSGAQWMPWISLRDWVAAVLFLSQNREETSANDTLGRSATPIEGPVNLAAPNPVTNAEFTRALGRALGRPTIFPVPRFALRLALGQLADEALLASARMTPKRLLEAGFEFADPEIENFLRSLWP